jgi:hypothetical protein
LATEHRFSWLPNQVRPFPTYSVILDPNWSRRGSGSVFGM